MYKKITHNIIEEHFDYPVEPSINGGTTKVSAVWPVLPNTWSFISSLKNQFTEYNNSLRSYAISALSNSADLDYVRSELTSSANNFSMFFEPYYGQANSNTLVGHLNSFSGLFIEFVNAVNSGQDTASIKIRITEKLSDFIKTMYTVNLNWWTNINIKPEIYLNTWAQALMDQAVARKAKDWAADNAAASSAHVIIANGPVYQSPFNSNIDFATIVANSIVIQFPNKFN